MKQFLKHFITFSAHNSALKWSKNLTKFDLVVSRNMKELKNKNFAVVFSIDKAEK